MCTWRILNVFVLNDLLMMMMMIIGKGFDRQTWCCALARIVAVVQKRYSCCGGDAILSIWKGKRKWWSFRRNAVFLTPFQDEQHSLNLWNSTCCWFFFWVFVFYRPMSVRTTKNEQSRNCIIDFLLLFRLQTKYRNVRRKKKFKLNRNRKWKFSPQFTSTDSIVSPTKLNSIWPIDTVSGAKSKIRSTEVVQPLHKKIDLQIQLAHFSVGSHHSNIRGG